MGLVQRLQRIEVLVERGALVVADGFRRAEVGGVGAAPAIRRWLGIVTSGDWSEEFGLKPLRGAMPRRAYRDPRRGWREHAARGPAAVFFRASYQTRLHLQRIAAAITEQTRRVASRRGPHVRRSRRKGPRRTPSGITKRVAQREARARRAVSRRVTAGQPY